MAILSFVIVDCAVYEHGRRRPGKLSLEQAHANSRQRDCFAWLGVVEPPAEELGAMAR